MQPSLSPGLLAKLRLKESWVIFFVLGLVVLNYPFIHIFSKPETILNIPLLYLYLQMGWFASILVVVLFRKAMDIADRDTEDGKDEQ
jgi:hypothetical protein